MERKRYGERAREFGRFIRERRESRGLEQQELAKKVEMSAPYLSMIESGTAPPPSVMKIHALADALREDRYYLIVLAGRLEGDIKSAIQNRPKEMMALVRVGRVLVTEDLRELLCFADTLLQDAKQHGRLAEIEDLESALKQAYNTVRDVFGDLYDEPLEPLDERPRR